MQSTTSPKKVLLVDDDRQQFLLIGYLLSEAHYDEYRLIWCQDLEKGLDHIESDECDVVLLDYHWGVNCKNFIKRAHRLNSRIPIVVMTDDIEHEVDRKAISEGASDYLIKETINSEVLERTVRYSIERKKIEQRLDKLAHYDALTHLPNRVLFLDRLHQLINLAQRSNDRFTLMYIDLNHFKAVNDNYGHAIGDKLLQEFASRIQAVVRSTDTVARIGGDEFTILLNNMESTPSIISLAQKIIENIQRPFVIDTHTLLVGCSIGIAVFPSAGSDAETLQRHADMAMYQAKQTGTSCYRFFVQENDNKKHIEYLSLRHIKAEVDNKRLTLRYSPRVDLNNNGVVAINVKPVWNNPDLGLMRYDSFLTMIESYDGIKFLSEWMIDQSLKEIRDIYTHRPINIAFCVRCSQLQSPKFTEYVKKVVKKYNINMHHIEFSVWQDTSHIQEESLKECIENINDMGATFSLHAYGENTLSLTNMNHYDIDSLQLSPYLSTKNDDKKHVILQETLVMLAHRLQKTVVANDLQTDEDVNFMRAIRCDYAQGGIIGEDLTYEYLQRMIKDDSIVIEIGGS